MGEHGGGAARPLSGVQISLPIYTDTQPGSEIDIRRVISHPRRRAGSGCVEGPPRRKSSSVRFERNRGRRSFADSIVAQRPAADQPVQSAPLWRLRALSTASTSHHCGDDAPSAAAGCDHGSVRDEIQLPHRSFCIAASGTLRVELEYRTGSQWSNHK
jgi:hypothetical protein